MRAFDTQTELFLSNVPTLPELTLGEIDLAALVAAKRRRTFTGCVAATMAVCFAVLTIAVWFAPVLQ